MVFFGHFVPSRSVNTYIHTYVQTIHDGALKTESGIVFKALLKSTKATLCFRTSMVEDTHCIRGASGLLICKLVWAVGLLQKSRI